MSRPEVSVIIPAFKAEDTLPEALLSIADAGISQDRIEVIIASDDGQDYSHLLPRNPMLRFADHGPVRSGAGPARNRAQALARGRFIAFLDADDSWAPGYLAALLPLAERAGAAFGLTTVMEEDEELLTLPYLPARWLTLDDLGTTGASFHPVLRRELMQDFTDLPSQDVRHAAELLARLGGSAPLGTGRYRLHLRPDTTTRAEGFSQRVALAYARHAGQIRTGDLPEPLRHATAAVFSRKAQLNRDYAHDGAGRSFYAYLADRLGAPKLPARACPDRVMMAAR